MGMVHGKVASVFVAVGILILAGAVPAFATGYLTTTVMPTGLKQTTLSGYDLVRANYTDSSSTSFTGFIYLDLFNSTGRSIFVSIGSCAFVPSQGSTCYVALPLSISPGAYTAKVFATTTENVPISTASSLEVTL
jgi:hypothetical protein